MSVLDRLTALFTGPAEIEEKPLPPTDVPHALGALLVRVALSDHQYAVEEIARIDRVLAKFQDIGPIDAAKLRAECERLEAVAPDTTAFTALLNQRVDYADRLKMVAALWQVVYADGALKDVEKRVMHLTQTQLGIQASDCTAAQADAQAQAAINNSVPPSA